MVKKLWETLAVYCISVRLPDNPLRNLNSYVIQDSGETLVVDTGFKRPECRDDLLQGLEELEVDWSKTSLFLTHLHSDHIGLVWDFLERGCKVYMNRLDLDIASKNYPDHWSRMERIYSSEGFPDDILARQQKENQVRAFAPEFPIPITPVENGTGLQVGRYALRCIQTPGHTPGHTVLYQPEQELLFSGDHILFDITPNINIWEALPNALGSYLQSLKMLRGLPVKRTFPAHRGVVGSMDDRIDALLRHHDTRLSELMAAIRAHPGADGYTLAGYLTWSARGMGWESFPPHQKWFATGETLAHLYYLEAEGQILRRGDQGKWCYFPAAKPLDK